MKRLVVLVAVVALLIALFISGLSDTTALVADTGISDNDKASSVVKLTILIQQLPQLRLRCILCLMGSLVEVRL